MPKHEAFCSLFSQYKGKRLRLLTVALDTDYTVAFAPLSGMTMNVRGEVHGAGEGIRTLDFNLGKVALYP
jgi:hypothetical protein